MAVEFCRMPAFSQDGCGILQNGSCHEQVSCDFCYENVVFNY